MLFQRNYDRPGPGVRPDEPRKTGLLRFFEVVARDWFSFWRAGALAVLCCLPMAACLALGVFSSAFVFYLAAIPLGIPAGMGVAGLYDTVLRSLRDEAGFWWYRYRRAFCRNARASVVPGALTGLVWALLTFNGHQMILAGPLNGPDLALYLAGAALLLGYLGLVWPQVVLVELPAADRLRNAALLFASLLPRVLLAAALQTAYAAFMVLYFPVSLLPFLLTNLWLPAVCAALAVYKPLNERFGVEETLSHRYDE